MRAPPSEGGGRAFESRRDNQTWQPNTEGGAWRHATGPENRADLTVEGSTPSPSARSLAPSSGCLARACAGKIKQHADVVDWFNAGTPLRRKEFDSPRPHQPTRLSAIRLAGPL